MSSVHFIQVNLPFTIETQNVNTSLSFQAFEELCVITDL